MSIKTINITLKNLNIRLKGFSSETVQMAVNGLNRELLEQIALEKITAVSGNQKNGKVATMDVGVYSFTKGKNAGPSDIRQAIATRVSKAIVSGITNLNTRKVK